MGSFWWGARRGAQAKAGSALTAAVLAGALCTPALAWRDPPPSSPAASAQPANQDDEQAEDAADEIVVSGHRLQRGSVAIDVPPEASIDTAAVRAFGAGDVAEVLEDIAPEMRSTGGGEDAIILVNGMRISSVKSIKDFPPEAIRRIEIFPERAAVQLGYRPDQRVVNVVLRGNYRAVTLLGRYTLAPEQSHGVYRGKVDLLQIDGDRRSNIDLDFRHEDPLYGPHTVSAAPSGSPGPASDADAPPARTLASQLDHLALSGGLARPLGTASLELDGHIELEGRQSRLGLSDQDAALLDAGGRDAAIGAPIGRIVRHAEGHGGLTVNGTLSRWQWSLVGNVDAAATETQTRAPAGNRGFESIFLPSPGLLGDVCRSGDPECAATRTQQGGADLYANGTLATLPAGAIVAALRSGFALSHLDATTAAADRSALARQEVSAQANVIVPISGPHGGIGVGKLALGMNGELRHLSDFGSLAKYGADLDWSPVTPLSLTASISREEQAPTLMQLGEAALDTPYLRLYDFDAGTTAIVRRNEGGNSGLRPESSRIIRLRAQLRPLARSDVSLSAEYSITRTRRPIDSFSIATPALGAAFPDRFVRDGAGNLLAIDERPLNFDARDRRQLRSGINLTEPLGGGGPATSQADRRQIQVALYHTWHFENALRLRAGQPALDLLDGEAIDSGGGSPRHEIELQSTINTGAFSANIAANWQSSSRVSPAGAAEALRYSQGVKLNLRIQIDLAGQQWLTRHLPWVHGRLNLSMDNVLAAHRRVTDAAGAVPLAYKASYIDPVGRSFRITLRKRFH